VVVVVRGAVVVVGALVVVVGGAVVVVGARVVVVGARVVVVGARVVVVGALVVVVVAFAAALKPPPDRGGSAAVAGVAAAPTDAVDAGLNCTGRYPSCANSCCRRRTDPCSIVKEAL
jgi:hypothetical protein